MAVEWTSRGPVDLESPVMIVAFEGWNDAADVATDTIEQIELACDAEPIGEIAGDDYFDYLDQRPTVVNRGGLSRSVEWPRILVSVCRPPGLAQHVVTVRGPEPGLRWRRFASEFVDLVDTLGVTQVVLLGAFLADTPHTRPITLTGTAFSRERLELMDVDRSDYEGPTGMTGVLQQTLTEAGVPAVSVWAAIPHYVAAPPNPKGTARVLGWVVENLGVPVPLEHVEEEARLWEERVDAAAEEDEDLRDYIVSLEERGDDVDPEPDRGLASRGETMPLVDGDAIAAEFERFLRGDEGRER